MDTSSAPPDAKPKENHLLGSLLVLGFGVVMCLLMCVASWHIHASNHRQFWLDFAVLLFGIAGGWLVGTIISPTVHTESERFLKFGTAVGSFISGYVLSKADPLITGLVKREAWDTDSSLRLLMWFTGLILALMVTYLLRVYYLPPTDDELKELEQI